MIMMMVMMIIIIAIIVITIIIIVIHNFDFRLIDELGTCGTSLQSCLSCASLCKSDYQQRLSQSAESVMCDVKLQTLQTTFQELQLCFQARMADESQLVPHPRLQDITHIYEQMSEYFRSKWSFPWCAASVPGHIRE